MTTVALNDADMTTALEFVAAKLAEADVTVDFTSEQRTHIGRLGGRASDLDAVCHFDLVPALSSFKEPELSEFALPTARVQNAERPAS